MKTRRPLHFKEIVLLAVPVLLLGLYAFLVRDRGPFKLVVNETKLKLKEIKAVQSWEKNRRGFEMVTYFSYEGTRPDWWGKGVNPTDNVWIRFAEKDEKDDGSRVGGYSGTYWDKASSRYYFTFQGSLPDAPQFLARAVCHVTMELESGAPPFKKLAKLKTSFPAKDIPVTQS